MKKIFTKDMLLVFLMGLSSGLPFSLVFGTLQAWMRSEAVTLTAIGLFAYIRFPYALKFLWSPLMDRYSLLPIGRRRSWMLVSQILLALSIYFLATSSPKENLWMVAFWALMVTFFAATQDTAIDAWRREAFKDDELKFATSLHIQSYLFSMRMISGSLALILSDHIPWSEVYSWMILIVGLGAMATLMSQEPQMEVAAPKTLKEAVVEPMRDFFQKQGAYLILFFILLYKLGDNLALQMTIPFYQDIGFTRTEIGTITKVVGWVFLTIGGLAGGFLMLNMSIYRALFAFGIFQALTTLGFVAIAFVGKHTMLLTAIIGLENLSIGMGTAAFAAFIAMLVNRKFTATQYALLASFMAVPGHVISGPSGFLADKIGWVNYFLMCTLVAIPGLYLIKPLSKLQNIDADASSKASPLTLRKVLGAGVALLAAILGSIAILAASRSDQLRVENSVLIQAPSDKIFALVGELQNWPQWSPWQKNIHIVELQKNLSVNYQVEFLEPTPSKNWGTISLRDKDAAVEITWTLEGKTDFWSRVQNLVYGFEESLHKEQVSGLSKLKQIAEASP